MFNTRSMSKLPAFTLVLIPFDPFKSSSHASGELRIAEAAEHRETIARHGDLGALESRSKTAGVIRTPRAYPNRYSAR
jgi:hypothetical protein